MSTAQYAYVILKDGVPIGGSGMKYRMLYTLDDLYSTGYSELQKQEGIKRTIEALEKGEIQIWRARGDHAANLTDETIAHQKRRLK